MSKVKWAQWCMILLAPLLAASSCEDVDDAVNVRSGRCVLTQNFDSFLCIDFPNSFNSNTANEICEEEGARYENSHGTIGIDFLSGASNDCDTDDLAGSCGTDYGFIRFYDDEWTAVDAENACLTTHEGEWIP